MTFPWAISTSLANELGPRVLDELANLRPEKARACAVCGSQRAALEGTPTAVVSTTDPRGVVVIALAHLSCRAQVGDHWQGLMNSVSGAAGADASAVFASRQAPAPRAVLLFEPAELVFVQEGQDNAAPLLDAHTLAHRSAGFTLATGALEDLTAPVAPGWLISVKGGNVQLAHPQAGVSYTQPVDDAVRDWLTLANAERAALVVTGPTLGLSDAGAGVDAALAAGRVLAATVAVAYPR